MRETEDKQTFWISENRVLRELTDSEVEELCSTEKNDDCYAICCKCTCLKKCQKGG